MGYHFDHCHTPFGHISLTIIVTSLHAKPDIGSADTSDYSDSPRNTSTLVALTRFKSTLKGAGKQSKCEPSPGQGNLMSSSRGAKQGADVDKVPAELPKYRNTGLPLAACALAKIYG